MVVSHSYSYSHSQEQGRSHGPIAKERKMNTTTATTPAIEVTELPTCTSMEDVKAGDYVILRNAVRNTMRTMPVAGVDKDKGQLYSHAGCLFRITDDRTAVNVVDDAEFVMVFEENETVEMVRAQIRRMIVSGILSRR
jgi:hypothetical protein